MLGKDKVGACFFSTGLFFLLVSAYSKITGNIVLGSLENHVGYLSYSTIIGFVFLIVSFIIFTSRESLDAIVIPTGGGEYDSETNMYSQDRDRAQKAIRRRNRLNERGYYVISGARHDDEKVKGGQVYSIYNFLREHGIKPSEIMIEGKSKDTLENVLYTLKKVKNREEKNGVGRPWNIAFVSYPEHLERFDDFEKEAIKRGVIEKKDFKFHKIRTFPKWKGRKKQRSDEKNYESNLLRRLFHRYKLVKPW